MAGRFSVVALDPGADRSRFECGVETLNRYFKTQASQDIKRRVTACFTAVDGSGRVAGFYTLASASILLTDLGIDTQQELTGHGFRAMAENPLFLYLPMVTVKDLVNLS